MSDKVNFLKFIVESEDHAGVSMPVKQLADAIPAMIYACDVRSHHLTYGNRAFIDFTGFEPAQAERSTSSVVDDIIYASDIPLVWKVIEAVAPHQYPAPSIVCRMRNSSGAYTYCETHINVLLADADGNPATVLFISRELRDNEKANVELEATKKLLEETEILMHFGSWCLDSETGAMSITPGLWTLLGYQTSETADTTVPYNFFLGHLVNGYQQVWKQQIQQVKEVGGEVSFECVLRCKDRSRKIVSTKAKLDTHDSSQKIIGITRDITAVRYMEKEQERSIRELNRSNKDLEEFAYVASHDLQEPLRKIAMFTERLKSKFHERLEGDGSLFIDRIVASADNMRILIDNLLEFSRTSRSSREYNSVNLVSVFDQVLSDLELKIEESKSVIRFQGTLPTIEAVHTEMKQLFSNLISNAIKFRKKDSLSIIEVIISLLGSEDKRSHHLDIHRNYFQIDIRDNGIGFEEVYGEKIFQIFQRLHGKCEYPGSGIGLAICKKITDNHNGVIYAQSVPDEGSTFTVILPEKQL